MSNKKIGKKDSIEIKNYVILFVIFFITISVTLYLCDVYKVYDESKMEEPIIRGSLIEIYPEDLNHYVVDTPNVIVYMCSAKDIECRNFEKKLKKFVKRHELTEDIVYLNLTDVDYSSFMDEFNNTYKLKNKLKGTYPVFVSFTDGEVEALLHSSKNSSLTISKLQNFVELYKLEVEKEEELDEDNEEVNTEELQ